MVAHTSNIATSTKVDYTISIHTWGIVKVLQSIDLYKTKVSSFARFPLSNMFRVKVNEVNTNLQKLENIGKNLFQRLKHIHAMGAFDGRNILVQQLETEIDLFYEMMKVQSIKYAQTIPK